VVLFLVFLLFGALNSTMSSLSLMVLHESGAWLAVELWPKSFATPITTGCMHLVVRVLNTLNSISFLSTHIDWFFTLCHAAERCSKTRSQRRPRSNNLRSGWRCAEEKDFLNDKRDESRPSSSSTSTPALQGAVLTVPQSGDERGADPWLVHAKTCKWGRQDLRIAHRLQAEYFGTN